MKELTSRQQAFLRFVCQWQQTHGYAPSLREIAAHFKVNLTAAAKHMRTLELKGALQRESGKRRSISVSEEAKLFFLDNHRFSTAFPLVGVIPAGVPLAVEEMTEDFLHITPEWFGRGQMMAVRVLGESMSGDSIRDGDIAIIKLQKHANAQEIVAVRIDGEEFTLKRLQIHNGSAALVASNPNFPVRMVEANRVEIVGVLQGIIRKQK